MKMDALAAAFCGLAFASLAHRATAQDALDPPPGSTLLLEAEAAGAQVYVCAETDKGFAWVFDGPAASLFNATGPAEGLPRRRRVRCPSVRAASETGITASAGCATPPSHC